MQIQRPMALGDRVAEILRLKIVQGEMLPGTHLVEGTLAAEHDVSRGPVRDALRLLTGEGLLESRRRGFYVKAVTNDDIDELYDIREAAEHLACQLAIKRSEPSDWRRAQELIEQMLVHAKLNSRHEYAKADLAFHTQFYVNSGSSRLLSLWKQYEPLFAALLNVTNAQDTDLRPSAQDHANLMELTLGGDTQAVADELNRHLAGSRSRMHTALEHRLMST